MRPDPDPQHKVARRNREFVDLTAHEIRVLLAFCKTLDGKCPKWSLFDHLYDRGTERDSDNIQVFIGRLRAQLQAELIETRRGLGFRIGDATKSEGARQLSATT